MNPLTTRVRNERRFSVWFAVAFLVVATSLGCGKSKGGGSDDDPKPVNEPETTARALELIDPDGTFEDEFVGLGMAANFVYVLDLGAPLDDPFESITFDIQGTLDNLVVDPPVPPPVGPPLPAQADGSPAAASAGATAAVTVRVKNAAGEADVCTTGLAYGPFTIPLDGTDADDDSAGVTPATIEAINEGNASFCVTVENVTEAVVLSLDRIALDVEECDVAADNLEGVWEGTYTCDDECGDDFGGDIRLQIFQEGFNATYEELDGTGEFRGTTCGSRFRFSGGYGCDELACEIVESGTFTRIEKHKAIKRSKYSEYNMSLHRYCTGTCEDKLTRTSTTPPSD